MVYRTQVLRGRLGMPLGGGRCSVLAAGGRGKGTWSPENGGGRKVQGRMLARRTVRCAGSVRIYGRRNKLQKNISVHTSWDSALLSPSRHCKLQYAASTPTL